MNKSKQQVKRMLEIHNLVDAIREGDLKAAKAMLDANPRIINGHIRHFDITSPLSSAVKLGDREVVEDLLARRARVPKSSALHAALRGGKLELATILLEHGGNINEVNNTFYHEQESGLTPLVSAIHGGKIESVQWALDHGADVNGKCRIHNRWYDTFSGVLVKESIIRLAPLHEAIRQNGLEIVKLLISRGANIYQVVSNPQKSFDENLPNGNAIHFAAAFGSKDICEIIMDGQPDARVMGRKNNKNSPIRWTIEHENCESLVYLLKRGADITWQCDKKQMMAYLIIRHREAKGALAHDQ